MDLSLYAKLHPASKSSEAKMLSSASFIVNDNEESSISDGIFRACSSYLCFEGLEILRRCSASWPIAYPCYSLLDLNSPICAKK